MLIKATSISTITYNKMLITYIEKYIISVDSKYKIKY